MLTSAYLLSQLPLQPPLKGVEQDVNGLISPAPDVTGGGDILTHPLPQATFWTLEVNLEGRRSRSPYLPVDGIYAVVPEIRPCGMTFVAMGDPQWLQGPKGFLLLGAVGLWGTMEDSPEGGKPPSGYPHSVRRGVFTWKTFKYSSGSYFIHRK